MNSDNPKSSLLSRVNKRKSQEAVSPSQQADTRAVRPHTEQANAQVERQNFDENKAQIERFIYRNQEFDNVSPNSNESGYKSDSSQVISDLSDYDETLDKMFKTMDLENESDDKSSPVNFNAQAHSFQTDGQLFRPQSIRPSSPQPVRNSSDSTTKTTHSFSSISAFTDKSRSQS